MKTATIILLGYLVTGCTNKPNDAVDLKNWSLRRHLDSESEWGAVQAGISTCLRQTDAGIVLVVHNDGPTSFEIDPFFEDGYNVEIEAYDEHRIALTDLTFPTFITRMPSPLVKLEPGKEFVSEPIGAFHGNYQPPSKARWLVALWFRNILGTHLRGPVITGPLPLRQVGPSTQPDPPA